jgi:type III pantothenate kinase
MSFNLTIDQGNSSAKMALWDGDRMAARAVVGRLTAGAVGAFVGGRPVARAIYCSVAGDGAEVLEALRGAGVGVLALDADTPLPITVDYLTPSTLGRDRVAAAVGAWSLYGGDDILVVDLGTAITYDAVTASGHYAGGNIAPGVGMRLEALHRFTARLPLVEAEGAVEPWGRTTATALRSGAIGGVAGEIERYRSMLGDGCRVTLTGGDARLVAPWLGFEPVIDPHLVDKGLNRILLYNEDI